MIAIFAAVATSCNMDDAISTTNTATSPSPSSSAPTLATVRKALFSALFSDQLLMNPSPSQAAQTLLALIRMGTPGVTVRRMLLKEFRDRKGGSLVHDFAAAGKLECCKLLVQDLGKRLC